MGCFTSSSKEEDSSISLQSSKKLKIVIVGLEGSGKTAILQYLKNGKFVETQSTIGNYCLQIGLNVETIQFKQRNYLIFDVGGKVRTLWSHYYENLDGLVFVIDSTDKEKFVDVKEEITKLGKDLHEQKIVMLIYFNKTDKTQGVEMEQLLKETNLQQQESEIIIQRCSARNGQGIWDGIEKLNSLLDHKFLS